MRIMATKIAATAVMAVFLAAFGSGVHAQPQEIDDLRDRYRAATNANDASVVASLHAQDARVMPPGADMLDGRAAIEEHFSRRFQMTTPSNFQVTSTQTRAVGDAYLDYGAYSMDAMIPGGRQLAVTGDYMALIEQRDGEWLIVLQIFNEDEPAPR